jgi:hypothetical protein
MGNAMNTILQAAIEAAVYAYESAPDTDSSDVAMERAIRAALSHLGEPIAWMLRGGIERLYSVGSKEVITRSERWQRDPGAIPLYLAPPTPTVKVKPLVWESVSDHVDDADGMGVLYRVLSRSDGTGALRTMTAWRWAEYDTPEAAKAAAQADYEARILSAIEGDDNG